MPRPVESEIESNPRVRELCQAMGVAAQDKDLTLRFLRDLLSFKELLDIANRWAAAQMLMSGRTQTQTAQQLGMSTKTVSEVALWVHGPFQTRGYWEVFDKLGGEAEPSGLVRTNSATLMKNEKRKGATPWTGA